MDEFQSKMEMMPYLNLTTLSLNFSSGIAGLIVLVVAFLFKEGNRLHEEQKLTV